MSIFATALINWGELWRIILAALFAGTGVVIVFGLLLLGISRGKTATKLTARYGVHTLSGLCGVLVLAVAAVGIYAVTQKPASAKPKQTSLRDDRSNQCHATTRRRDYMNRGHDDHEAEQAGDGAGDRCNATAYALISSNAPNPL
jgi:hypothetical protein